MQAGQVIQGPNGQHIVVHAVPQASQAIQLATPASNPALQPLQVLPISTLQVKNTVRSSDAYDATQYRIYFSWTTVALLQAGGGGCNQIIIPQQAQILQTADGQTYIYQPSPAVQVENTIQQSAQPTRKDDYDSCMPRHTRSSLHMLRFFS